MKKLLLFCVLSFVDLSLANTVLYPRGCYYIDGLCEKECEIGTHAYTSDCTTPVDPEPTCAHPHPKTNTKIMYCDFSDCYCDPPTVRNEKSGKCVPIHKCPKSKFGYYKS